MKRSLESTLQRVFQTRESVDSNIDDAATTAYDAIRHIHLSETVMLRRTLPSLLAALIAACPLTCQVIALASHDCVSSDACAAKACEHCRGGAAENGSGGDRNGSPVPSCPCREKGQNCICSGALINGDDADEFDLLPSLDLPTDLSSFSLSATGAYGELSRDDNRLYVISGRDVRALISSFLC